jgi:hypothetical protein
MPAEGAASSSIQSTLPQTEGNRGHDERLGQGSIRAVGQCIRAVEGLGRARESGRSAGAGREDSGMQELAFAAFPRRQWRQIWSTNPLERVNKEIKRRTDVVGVFPNSATLLRLAGSVLIEQHDEWEAGERRYFSEASMLELATMNNPIEVIDVAVTLPELAAASTKTTDPHGVENLHHSAGRDPMIPISATIHERSLTDFVAHPQPSPSALPGVEIGGEAANVLWGMRNAIPGGSWPYRVQRPRHPLSSGPCRP